jgi:hypothetical protein
VPAKPANKPDDFGFPIVQPAYEAPPPREEFERVIHDPDAIKPILATFPGVNPDDERFLKFFRAQSK